MDVVKPDNLNIGFLREFMMLPTSYYETGAAIKFRKLNYLTFNEYKIKQTTVLDIFIPH